jgi:hypothetical protein
MKISCKFGSFVDKYSDVAVCLDCFTTFTMTTAGRVIKTVNKAFAQKKNFCLPSSSERDSLKQSSIEKKRELSCKKVPVHNTHTYRILFILEF